MGPVVVRLTADSRQSSALGCQLSVVGFPQVYGSYLPLAANDWLLAAGCRLLSGNRSRTQQLAFHCDPLFQAQPCQCSIQGPYVHRAFCDTVFGKHL